MWTTVADVKDAARKLWPNAVKLHVEPINPTDTTPKRYRITAMTADGRVIGRMSDETLRDLHSHLQRITTRHG